MNSESSVAPASEQMDPTGQTCPPQRVSHVVWCGVVWRGVARRGVVWCGVVWCGEVWCGVVWCGVVWCGVEQRLQ